MKYICIKLGYSNPYIFKYVIRLLYFQFVKTYLKQMLCTLQKINFKIYFHFKIPIFNLLL